MIKTIKRGFAAWGHYLLALLCAGIILLSAAWTREERMSEAAEQQALFDQSQRLEQVKREPIKNTCSRPTDGEILRGYSEETMYFPIVRIWQKHHAVDFAAADGDKVRAMLDGTVVACEDGCVCLCHEDGLKSIYRGLKQIDVSRGQSICQGAAIGLAGARIPHEGAGFVCVSLLENDVPIPFL